MQPPQIAWRRWISASPLGGCGPAYGWAFSTEGVRANVGIGTFDVTRGSSRRELIELLFKLFPELSVDADLLAGHLLPLSSARPHLGSARVLLAGEAAGLVDPITGEGIHAALESGMLAGCAAVEASGDPATFYRRSVRQRMGRRLRHLRLASRAYRPDPVNRLIAAGAHSPPIARATAAIAVGGDSWRDWARVAAAAVAGPRHEG